MAKRVAGVPYFRIPRTCGMKKSFVAQTPMRFRRSIRDTIDVPLTGFQRLAGFLFLGALALHLV